MSRSKPRRVVSVNVLPGEPTDGTGRVCIHLFVPDPEGPFVEPSVMHPVFKDGVRQKQQVEFKPTRGRLACDPKRSAVPTTVGNVTIITPRTDDPRAVTCPKCMASADYTREMSATGE